MSFIDNILEHYSWQGIALVVILVILFFVQLYYHAIAYRSLYRYRLMRGRKQFCQKPAISVIVVARGEDENFLTSELPLLLTQQYDNYEVVVVYVGGDMSYYGELKYLQEENMHLRLTRMGGNERLYITTKQALNVGIKSAQHNCLLFTTPGAMPHDDMWVDTMSRGFERGSVVIAPAVPQFEKETTKTYLMRMAEFNRSRNAMTMAVRGNIYWAPRSNFGFTRDLYNSTRGFDHLNLDLGENDLYLQTIAQPERIAVVMSPHSIMVERRPDEWREWIDLMRFYDTTRAYYPATVGTFARWESGSRMLFLLVALTTMVVMPLEVRLMALALVILRYFVVVYIARRTARKLGERNIAWRYWIFDLLGPTVEHLIATHHSQKCTSAWR